MIPAMESQAERPIALRCTLRRLRPRLPVLHPRIERVSRVLDSPGKMSRYAARSDIYDIYL